MDVPSLFGNFHATQLFDQPRASAPPGGRQIVGHQLSDPYANPGRSGKLREGTEIELSLAQRTQFGHFPFPFPRGPWEKWGNLGCQSVVTASGGRCPPDPLGFIAFPLLQQKGTGSADRDHGSGWYEHGFPNYRDQKRGGTPSMTPAILITAASLGSCFRRMVCSTKSRTDVLRKFRLANGNFVRFPPHS